MRGRLVGAWLLILFCAAIGGLALYSTRTIREMLAADQYSAGARLGQLFDLWMFPIALFLWVIAGLLTPALGREAQARMEGSWPPRLPFAGRIAEFAACLLIFAIPSVTHLVHRSLASASSVVEATHRANNLVEEGLAARSAFDESAARTRLLLALAIDRDNVLAKEQLLNAPTLDQLLSLRTAKPSAKDRFERFKLAMWCREQGDEALARRELQAILTVNPEDPSALGVLAVETPRRGVSTQVPPPPATPQDVQVPPGMVYVPEGQFRIHEGREVRKVRSFFIDRCEVTNAEYAKFLDEVERNGDAGYCHPRQPARKDHTPAQWGDPIFNAPELPVVGVDWFDAYAFATWAKKRLPTDEEWEAAARGVEGRIFPWGDRWERSLANTPDRFLVYELWGWATVDWAGWVPSAAARDAFIKLSAATPAGAFLRDQSPFGCLDMAGNVEEWVADWFGAESSAGGGPASGGGVPAAPGADTAICGVRGGSWVYGGLQRPLSFRTGAEPLARATYRGFRCAK